MIKKEDISEVFRARLRACFEEQSLNATAFCHLHGIDRTTFGQLLSSDYHRLPRADTIVQIAEALNISLDWLLGLSEDKNRGAEILKEALNIEQTEDTATAEDIWIAWHKDSEHQKISHVPVTFPEHLKTRDFFIYEYSPIIGQKQAAIEFEKMSLPLTANETAVCLSLQQLQDFVHGGFIYADMPKEHVKEQLEHMAQLLEEGYPRYNLYLYDSRDLIVPSFTIFGATRVALYINEKYLLYTTSEHINFFRSEFDQLIRCAVIHPHEVVRYIQDLLKQL